ncbi:MAG: DUF2029 domain-containing protein [Ruminococcaceae bacterium]|nr:DUF2029 domain-containing protein [Oscillospiraceae bacterium]
MKKKIAAILSVLLTTIIPLPSFAVYSNLTKEEAVSYYKEYMILGTVLFLVIAIGLFAYWYYLVNQDKIIAGKKVKKSKVIEKDNSKEIFQVVLMIIGIGLFVRLVAAIPSPGFANDVALFKYWGRTAADDFVNTYNILGSNIDYPPGYVYILATCGFIAKIFGAQDTVAYDLIIKLPAILADCGIALFIYKFCKDRVPKKWIYFFVAFWMANPLAFIDSTVWGQVDSVLTLASVAGFYFVSEKKFIWASMIFGVGVMLKPQAIIVLPVLCYALFKNKKVKTFILSALTGVGTAVLVALPFAVNVDMSTAYMQESVTPVLETLHANGGGFITTLVTPFAWILSLFMGTAGHYDYASVNALNFFFSLGGNWVKDDGALWGLTWFIWGMIFIVIAAALTWFLHLKTKDSKALPFVSASVILLLVANFGPRMHERYFFPAIVFLLIAAIIRNNRCLFGIGILASVFGYFTVLEVLVDLNLGTPYMWLLQSDWPASIHGLRCLISWGNVVVASAVAVFAIADSFDKIKGTGFDKKIWR